jgi:hypothetical protein
MNQKLKSENYMGLGGINVKFSPYITGPMEFLDLQNLDFQMPGAHTQRWGSTMYVGQTLSGRVNALTEFSRLDGTSMVIAGCSGALWYGATTGQMQGISFLGATSLTTAGSTFGFLNFNQVVGTAGGVIMIQSGVYFQGQANLAFSPNANLAISGQTIGSNNLSSAALNNYFFAADGNQFFKFDGTTTSFVGIPPVTGALTYGTTVYNAAGPGDIGVGATGYYSFYASLVNRRGFEGQIWPICANTAASVSSATLGGTFIQTTVGILIPPQYDVSSINLYSYWSSATLFIGSTTIWNKPYVFQRNVPLASASLVTSSVFGGVGPTSGLTLALVNLGTTLGGMSALINNGGQFPDPIVNSYYPIGFTLVNDPLGSPFPTSSQLGVVNEVAITSFVPRFLETHQNRLFLAGFSSAPSISVYSDVGEPEGYPLENEFEVRTNDADVIVGMKSYNSRLYYFKRKSFHVLSGDTNANYRLDEVSHQFGAVNNRCIVTFDDNERLMFLDRKGLMAFNGAVVQHVSLKVQPYFDRMNYNAAATEACMVHDKLRNQVLCAIPIDGSSINNITIVYDYAADAWTTQKGVAPSVFAKIQGRNNTENAFYGSYSGVISWYGPSFTSDNGSGFTCVVKSRFNHELGDSTQKQYRRLYLNIDPPSATLSIPVKFYQDYGTSVVLGTTLVIGEFQNRLEYGISAKSIAFEMNQAATNVPLRIYGYTLEERLQRKV